MDSKSFKNAVDLLVKEKGIDENIIYEAMELALTAAYKKNYNSLSNVRVDINRETGEIKVYSYKTVVDRSEEEKYKLQLFSKDLSEVAYAHQKLVELATAPLIAENEEMKPKAEYHDTVLKKDGLITTTIVAKDLGFSSAVKLNQVMYANHIIFKNKSGTWCPYAEYEWLISEDYADYQSYTDTKAKPCLKWTEKGRKWIIENYNNWVMNLAI